jgi:hypothetical protein
MGHFSMWLLRNNEASTIDTGFRVVCKYSGDERCIPDAF